MRKGYISEVPHFNSIFNYLENPELTYILMNLIEEAPSHSAPLNLTSRLIQPALPRPASSAGSITNTAS